MAYDKPLADVLAKIMQDVKRTEAHDQPAPCDHEIAPEVDRLYTKFGYIPCAESVEAIRAHMDGYGVLLTGPAGVGKTFLMKCLGVRIYTSTGIASYGLRGLSDFHEATQKGPICIDDLGIESIVSEWGAKDDVLKTFIAYRAERVTARTYITTNLSSEEITDRYGDRTLSRIMGMCKAFKLTGTNRREPQREAQT